MPERYVEFSKIQNLSIDYCVSELLLLSSFPFYLYRFVMSFVTFSNPHFYGFDGRKMNIITSNL